VLLLTEVEHVRSCDSIAICSSVGLRGRDFDFLPTLGVL
jgi:hypothetical protein